MDIIWLIVKLIVGGPIFIIFIGFFMLLFNLLGRPIAKRSQRSEGFVTIIAHIIYLYLWAFMAAFFMEVATYYHDALGTPLWILIIITYIVILFCTGETARELRRQRQRLHAQSDIQDIISERVYLGGGFNPKLYDDIILMTALRTSIVANIGFWILLIFPRLIQFLYGNCPRFLASL